MMGGSIALVNQEWITPRKSEVFWPPYKNQDKYYKALKNGDIPDERTWPIYKISRSFFTVDDYGKAIRKIKEAEITSDLQSEIEDIDQKPKRKKVARKLYENSSDKDAGLLERPPPLKIAKHLNNNKSNSGQVVNTPETSFTTSTPTSSRSSITDGQLLSQNDYLSNKSVVALLHQIKEQNKQILYRLSKQDFTNLGGLHDLPVELPLRQEEELIALENVLSDDKEKAVALSSYLSSIGGRDTTSLTNNVLKRCVSNQLACNYSFRGKGVKKAFANLHLNNVIINAVKSKNPQSLERDIEDHIKVWMKHSPQRHKIDIAKGKK